MKKNLLILALSVLGFFESKGQLKRLYPENSIREGIITQNKNDDIFVDVQTKNCGGIVFKGVKPDSLIFHWEITNHSKTYAIYYNNYCFFRFDTTCSIDYQVSRGGLYIHVVEKNNIKKTFFSKANSSENYFEKAQIINE